MTTLENDKLSTQKFLENAISEGPVVDLPKSPERESEKLILDEIATEKSAENGNVEPPNEPAKDLQEEAASNQTAVPETSPEDLHSNVLEAPSAQAENDREDLAENASEETESTRDLKSSERELSDVEDDKEQPQNEDDKEQPQDDGDKEEEWQNLLGSGVIMKKILKQGEPDTRPSRSDKCFITYTCQLEGADEDSFVSKSDDFVIALGEGDVIQGLDVAIGLMNKKERCLLKIGPRLAFGDRGLPPNIPAQATVVYDIELKDVQHEDELDNLSVEDRQKLGNQKRERGNWWYQRGENTLAIQCYRRALDFLDEVESGDNEHQKPSDSELQQLLEDRLKVLNNMASAQIKMELYDQALISLQTVLRCQPDNVKALFRKAKIYLAKNDLPHSLQLLERAKRLEPDDTLIAKEISMVTGIINKQKNSEREYARRMFGETAKGKMNKEESTSSRNNRRHIWTWTTIGASLIVGLAGVIAYKLKYP